MADVIYLIIIVVAQEDISKTRIVGKPIPIEFVLEGTIPRKNPSCHCTVNTFIMLGPEYFRTNNFRTIIDILLKVKDVIKK